MFLFSTFGSVDEFVATKIKQVTNSLIVVTGTDVDNSKTDWHKGTGNKFPIPN